MAIFSEYDLSPFDDSDPDDYRPNSRWALFVDVSSTDDSHVEDLTVIVEDIAPGDRIPLHSHPVDEVIVVAEGTPEVTLGDEQRQVGRGAVIFVPAEMPHGTRNSSRDPVRIHAFFPSEKITIRYVERNPAPGTEDDEPQPPVTIDVRRRVSG